MVYSIVITVIFYSLTANEETDLSKDDVLALLFIVIVEKTLTDLS